MSERTTRPEPTAAPDASLHRDASQEHAPLPQTHHVESAPHIASLHRNASTAPHDAPFRDASTAPDASAVSPRLATHDASAPHVASLHRDASQEHAPMPQTHHVEPAPHDEPFRDASKGAPLPLTHYDAPFHDASTAHDASAVSPRLATHDASAPHVASLHRDASAHHAPIIALTGPMAAGKNRAADFLQEAGCAVIDADKVAHQALCNVQSAVLDAFAPDCARLGVSLVDDAGKINRAVLAQIVFSSPQKLSLHESIIHPEITRLLEEFLSHNTDRISVLNATVLYKTPLINRCAFIIYVDAPFMLRLIRAKKRDSSSLLHLLKRFSAQKDLYAQYRKINVDIYKVQNRGKPAKLQKKILRILNNRT